MSGDALRVRSRGLDGRHRAPVALCLVIGLLLAACSSSPSASSALVVSDISNGSFHDGQTITISMGPNKLFTPNLRLNILQCADPGGKTSNLPTSAAQCDENTVEANTILPAANGSFTETGYTIYRLPSPTLGEGRTWRPICDTTNECVLYVGENQEDFTKPKIFSQPFVVTGGDSA